MSDDAFSRIVARADGAMSIVTTVADGERSGCLVGFHAQCSIDPPRYAVWVSVRNHTHGVIDRAAVVAVHLLDADQHDLAELFGSTTGDEIDKFAHCAWSPGPGGVPLLDDCGSRLVGHPTARLRDGDHELFVVAVDHAEVGPERGVPVFRLSDAAGLEPGHDA